MYFTYLGCYFIIIFYWQVALGSAFAIVVVKCLCGGLGQNIFNPALAARAFLLLVYPVGVTRYVGVDGVSAATPLHHMVMPALPEESILDMFLGNCPGSIGEISALALLLGGAYLLYRNVISIRIPAAYIATVAVLTLVFSKTGEQPRPALLCSGCCISCSPVVCCWVPSSWLLTMPPLPQLL